MAVDVTVAEALKAAYDTLSPSERKISRALLADYPAAGLESVQRLAGRANVSAPTVLRMVQRLGYDSYPAFQKRLREEISLRNASPLAQYGTRPHESGQTPLVARAHQVFSDALDGTFAGAGIHDLDAIAALLAAEKRRVWVTGGRYSDLLASYLVMHLKMLRRDVHHVPNTDVDRAFALMDLSARDIVVAFDYRRYEMATVDFVQRAKEKKASTVLFTDPWLSPAAKHADLLASSAVAAPSPFDSLLAPLALVETVIAALVDALGDAPRTRIEMFDSLQTEGFENDPTERDRS